MFDDSGNASQNRTHFQVAKEDWRSVGDNQEYVNYNALPGTNTSGFRNDYSMQFDEKSIFFNGFVRPFYFSDENGFDGSGNPIYKELRPIIVKGIATSGSNTTTLKDDSNVTNWLTETQVKVNDIVYSYNANAYGVITSVGSLNIDFTAIASASGGGIAMGRGLDNMKSGHKYEIYDLSELNVIRQESGFFDNVGVAKNAAAGGLPYSGGYVEVSGTVFRNTEVRQGDWIYNTTKSSFVQINRIGGEGTNFIGPLRS